MMTGIVDLWKRPKETQAIVEFLLKHPLINEVLIADQTLSNEMALGKFKKCNEASNKLIFWQDDDCLIHSIDKLVDEFYNHGEKYMVCGMKPDHMARNSGMTSMMGWGSIFDVDWLTNLNPYIEKYGEDNLLKREGERIFTGLTKHINVPVVVEDFPSASGDMALYLQVEHEKMKQHAIDRVAKLVAK